MRIALVTGRLAYPYVRRILGRIRTRHSIDVVVLPVQVIALLSTRDIALSLKRMGISLRDYDLLIVPGACRGSTTAIEEELGIRAVKGTLHADDLELVLMLDDPGSILSADKPADEVLHGLIMERNLEILRRLEEKAAEKSILVGGLHVPIRPPPFRIISEITSAHRLGEDELLRMIGSRIDDGADIISLGFEPFNPIPDKVYRLVRLVKENYDAPVAVDTLMPSEIEAAARAGADLILSIDYCNIEKLDLMGIGSALVLIPYDSCRSYMPVKPADRADYLSRLVSRVPLGVRERVILDPILDSPIVGHSLESLETYMVLSERFPEHPLLMGTGNYTELVDADSIGVNMVLATHALEAGASLLLTVEASDKTRGSTRELVIATQMVSIASWRGSPPKDLGIDLIVVKDKRRVTMPIEAEGAEVITLEEYKIPVSTDRAGIFKIRVDHDNGYIEALYIGPRGKKLIRARDAETITNYIIDKGLVSSLSHAAYLGRELAKAEEALRIGKNYVQERPLFTVRKPIKLEKRTEKQKRR